VDDAINRRFREAEPLGAPIARRLAQRLRGAVDVDDLLAFGRVGALDAAKKWDGRGSFLPFAAQRIKWAMIDGLRREHKLSRARPAAKAADLDALIAAECASDALGPPEGADAAASENLEAALVALIERAAVGYTLSVIAADSRANIEEDLERIRLRRAVGALPEPERTVVERHGYAGETFNEIAESLATKPSTVFSVYSRALDRLRKQFDPGQLPQDETRAASP
jgi:RNA polymerase sigma factor for flagellar operon FliA